MVGRRPRKTGVADHMRIATIDVGTNSAELLVAEVGSGAIRTVYEDECFVRLGEGVDAHGIVNEAALDRLKSALLGLRDAAQSHGAGRILVGATSASRDAANKQAIVDAVRRETGLEYDILSGVEEATWTFLAACMADAGQGSCAVFDIGGGSTEVIVGDRGGRGPEAITFRHSFNIGTVRLTERFFGHLPPRPDAIERAEAFIRQQLDVVAMPIDPAMPVLGNSGTAVALALVHAGPEAAWDELTANQHILSGADVRQWRERILACTADEVMALHPTAM